MSALRDALQLGSVAYDTGFGGMIEKDLNASFLVLSQGKSMFGIELCLPLIPSSNLVQLLPHECLEDLRLWLHVIKYAPHDIPPSLANVRIIYC